MANSWRDVTDCFSESQRHYRGTYMEMDEVYNESVEVSLFSAPMSGDTAVQEGGASSGILINTESSKVVYQ